MTDRPRMSAPTQDSVCACGELPVLVTISKYDATRSCPWCFGGHRPPQWMFGAWIDGEYLSGDDRYLLELFFLAFRRAAVRRRPELELLSHDDAVLLWAELSGEAMRWDPGVVQSWSLLMLNQHLNQHDAKAHLDVGGGTFPRDAVLPTVHRTVVEPTGLDALEREAGRLARLAEVIAESGGLPLPAEPALSPDETRRASLTQKGRWTAEAWSHDVPSSARRLVRYARNLRGAPGIGPTQVLRARVDVKVLLGRLLVCDVPAEVRPALAIWHCDRLRAAHADGNLARALDLLPDEHDVLTMAEQLLEPPSAGGTT